MLPISAIHEKSGTRTNIVYFLALKFIQFEPGDHMLRKSCPRDFLYTMPSLIFMFLSRMISWMGCGIKVCLGRY